MSRKNIKFRLSAVVTVACMSLLMSIAGLGLKNTAYAAESVLSGGDGTYSVPAELDLKMGADNFTNPVTVEKQNGRYYMTFGYGSAVGYMKLDLGNKEVGKTVEKKNGYTYTTYTLSENNLKSALSFSAYVTAMSREIKFTVKLNLTAASKTADTVRDIGERPAEFVPVIETKAATEYSLKVGAAFPVPQATAKMGGENCTVEIAAYYGGEVVEIVDGKLTLAEVGEYKLVYKAISSAYTTSLGNDSFSEYVVTIRSAAGENELVKIRDENGVLPKNISVIAGKVAQGADVYEKAASAMKKIADNFEVFSAEILSEAGETIAPTNKVQLLFRADDYFDRSKAEVYYIDENGNITKLVSNGYGRYIAAETDKTGTFIVCVPGVAFRMPMWGYVVISAGAVVVAAGITVTIVILLKRRKKTK